MNYLDAEEAEELYAKAMSVAKNAYAPFSEFRVGAAVMTNDGHIFTGVNVENASYGLTICAERIAIGSTIAGGCTDIRAIAVHAQVGSAPPCGACRQFILEFGEGIIVIFRHNNQLVQMPIGDLLPYAFTKKALQQP